MIVECGKVLIDTTLGHEAHRKAIGGAFLSCRNDEPVYTFTQYINDEQRFYHLTYNDHGTKLLRIDYWESMKEHEKPKKLEKRLKAKRNEEMCYFTRHQVFEEDEYEMVEVIDHTKNYTSKNHTTVWDHKWNDSMVDRTLTKPSLEKKSRWKFWS